MGVETPNTHQAQFRTTRWTQVLKAHHGESIDRREALNLLLERYWPAIYAFVRRSGFARADAEDLTQSFLSRLLDESFWTNVSPDAGRFRSFLKVSLKNFLADEADRQKAIKRGGGKVLSLDVEMVEQDIESTPQRPAEEGFDREWAWGLLRGALHRMEEESSASGKQVQYQALKRSMGPHPPPYEALATELGITKVQLANYLHRARARLGVLLRDEVEETCSDGELAAQEYQTLMDLFR
jgi:RNA polymerase sigma-70 factor (ECF subfamily)